jgi:hypothetical protein
MDRIEQFKEPLPLATFDALLDAFPKNNRYAPPLWTPGRSTQPT